MPEKILRDFFNTWTIWREEFQPKFKDPEKWNNFPLGICRNFGFGQFGCSTLFTGVSDQGRVVQSWVKITQG